MKEMELPEWCGCSSFGGFCPVQGEGEIDGAHWYFRARGTGWSITVHTSADKAVFSDEPPLYAYREDYEPEKQFAAGWMPHEVAAGFIARELEKWRKSREGTDVGKNK